MQQILNVVIKGGILNREQEEQKVSEETVDLSNMETIFILLAMLPIFAAMLIGYLADKGIIVIH